jgi:hypothetical protein
MGFDFDALREERLATTSEGHRAVLESMPELPFAGPALTSHRSAIHNSGLAAEQATEL